MYVATVHFGRWFRMSEAGAKKRDRSRRFFSSEPIPISSPLPGGRADARTATDWAFGFSIGQAHEKWGEDLTVGVRPFRNEALNLTLGRLN